MTITSPTAGSASSASRTITSPDSQCLPARWQRASAPAASGAVGDQRLVAGAVHHRPQVVRHAAVDGDPGRDVALDRLHRVQRDRRVGDQRPPGLEQQPLVRARARRAARRRSPPRSARRRAGAGRRGRRRRGRRRGCRRGSRRARRSPGPPRGTARARTAASRCGSAGRPGRSDGEPASRSIASRAASIEKPNFESAWPVEIAAWVSPATSGVTRISTSWRRPQLGGELRQPLELVEGVDHDVPDAGLQRLAQLGGRLGVAVQVDARRDRSRPRRASASSPPEATSQASPPRRAAGRRRCTETPWRRTARRSRRGGRPARRRTRGRGRAGRPRRRRRPACRTPGPARRRRSRRAPGGRAR